MSIATGRKHTEILNDVGAGARFDVFTAQRARSTTQISLLASSCSANACQQWKTSEAIFRCRLPPPEFSQPAAASAPPSQNRSTASRQFHRPVLASRWSVFPAAARHNGQCPEPPRPDSVARARRAPVRQTTQPYAADLAFSCNSAARPNMCKPVGISRCSISMSSSQSRMTRASRSIELNLDVMHESSARFPAS